MNTIRLTHAFEKSITVDPAAGKAAMDGIELSVRDAAFLSCLLIKQGRLEQAAPIVRGLHAAADISAEPLDTAWRLWVTGEYLHARGNHSVLPAGDAWLSAALDILEQGWRQPAAHWLVAGDTGLYVTNLAVCYSGIQAIMPHTADARPQRQLKSIRELVFAKFIKDGHLVSRLGDTGIDGDIVATAIPFGMLGIEDRILIEALYKLEAALVGEGVRFAAGDTYYGGCERPDLTCLLAWYYANKGDLARAKSLLATVDKWYRTSGVLSEVELSTAKEELLLDHWRRSKPDGVPVSPLSYILYELACEILQSGERASAQGASSTAFLHMPTGYDDPYVTQANERHPRHPEAGEAVLVRLSTQPFHAGMRMEAEVAAGDGEAVRRIPMQVETTAEGDKVWAARLGAFPAGAVVTYRFAHLEGETAQRSETYSFLVREWVPLDRVISFDHTGDDRIAVTLQGAGQRAAIAFDKTDAGSVRLSLQLQPVDRRHATPSPALRAAGGASKRALDPSTEKMAELLLADGRRLAVDTDERGTLALRLHDADGIVTEGSRIGGKPWLEALADGSGTVHKIRLNLRAKPEHRWFGMGERFAGYEYTGQQLDAYVYNQYRDQGLKTYMPVPLAISSGEYSVFLDTPLYSQFRFQTGLSDLLEIETDLSPAAQRLVAYLFVGEPLAMIERFAGVTGKPELPPKWAFGPWMSSNNWDSQAEVKKQAELTKRSEIPATVLVIEQWSDEATFYIFNDAQYEAIDGGEALRYSDFRFPDWGRWPDPKGMVDTLHNDGLKVLLWQIPVHKHMYGIAHAQRDRDEQTLLANGYCVANADGSPYVLPYNWFKDSHIVDYTNPSAAAWWFGKRKYLVEEIGVDGFKTDGGEFVFGHDLAFHDGSTGREMRNLYPNLYVGSYYDFIQKHNPAGGITFSRAGYTGAQRYPLHWAGDERSTYAAFRASLIAGLTSSMSGIPFWGWDLGGFHGDIPTAELYVRSAQMAAFCPVMQYHAETKGEFNQDRTPWNIADRTGSPDVIGLYKKYADIRMNLLPYIYDQAVQTSRTGKPMMRAMVLAYPQDPHCTEMTGQYMFGEHLLVAPVSDEGHVHKDVYFPEGTWLSLFSDEEKEGPTYSRVSADLDQIPVYMKQESAVALNLTDDLRLGGHVGNRTDRYERLCFAIYLKEELEASFEDDLGFTAAISARRTGNGVLLDWSSSREQPVTFVLRLQERPAGVYLDSAALVPGGEAGPLSPGQYGVRDGSLCICVDRMRGSLEIRA